MTKTAKQPKSSNQEQAVNLAEMPVLRRAPQKNVGGAQPAANDWRFSMAVNDAGVADKPLFTLPHKTRTGKSEAVVYAHRGDDQWVGGYEFAVRSGECQAYTLLPSKYDKRFDTQSKAIADAISRLNKSLDAKYPDASCLNKTEAEELACLRQWASDKLSHAKAGKFDQMNPLADKRFIDLFAGIGGFRSALETLGARCVLSCEIDEAARETYTANFDVSAHPFPSDITTLDAADVPDHDILVGGFPYQAFSIKGNQAGDDDPRGKLFFEIARIVAAKRPGLILLENVPQFVKLDGGTYAREAELTLARLGYAVSRKAMRAVDFGLPQLRERVFFVAIRRDIAPPGNVFAFPVGGGHRLKVADILEPGAPNGTINPARVELDPTRDPASLTRRIGKLDGRNNQDAVVMSPDGVGLTLAASETSSGLYLINGIPRGLTPRERARMQGFPESFVMHSNRIQACKQFGNSVAVPVVQAIAEAAAKQYFKQKEPRIKQAQPVELRDQPLPTEEGPTVARPPAAAATEPVMMGEVIAPNNTAGKGSYIPWAGAKAWSVQVLQSLLPESLGRAFFPFGGAASDAIGYADLFEEIYIADINQDLVNMHAWVASNPEHAIRTLQRLFTARNGTKKAFLRLSAEFNKEAPGTERRSALFVYLLRSCFRGNCTYDEAGQFTGSYGQPKNGKVPEKAIRRFSEKLGKACFTHLDAVTALDAAQSGDVVFLDPPYCPRVVGEKAHKKYNAAEFTKADYEAMVRGAERAAARGATVFAHDHHTSDTLALHPNATTVLPVKVARRLGKNRTAANEAIFIYRPATESGAEKASPRRAANRNPANDENFMLDEVLQRVAGSDCSFATEGAPSKTGRKTTGLRSVASNHITI